jgi:hypothetical protein
MSDIALLIVFVFSLSIFGPAKDVISFFKFILKGDTNE